MTILAAAEVYFAAAARPPEPGGDFTSAIAGELIVLLVAAPVLVVAGLLFINWWGWLAAQAESHGIRVSGVPGGAYGCWFIPVLNLYGPYAYARGLAAALKARAPVGAWWASWVIALVCGAAAAAGGESALRGGGPPLLLIAAIFLTVAGLLGVWVIGALQRALAGG